MKAWGQELTADDRRWLDWRWNWLIDQFGNNIHREIVLTEVDESKRKPQVVPAVVVG